MFVKHFDGLHRFGVQLAKARQENARQGCVPAHHGNNVVGARLCKETRCHGVDVVEKETQRGALGNATNTDFGRKRLYLKSLQTKSVKVRVLVPCLK